MSDERGKPRVISCAARNVAAYTAGTTPLSFRLSECNERTEKSLAIIIFTLRFLHFTHFVRSGRKERKRRNSDCYRQVNRVNDIGGFVRFGRKAR